MVRVILVLAFFSALLAPSLACGGGGDSSLITIDSIPGDAVRPPASTPGQRSYDDLLRFPADPFDTRRGPGARDPEGVPKGTPARAPGDKILLARRDLEKNGELFAALARFGSNPSPLGVARILDLIEKYPVEFWGLAARVGDAARNGDLDARQRLWQAVWVFREAGVVNDEDWDDLGYVLARVNQGNPIFYRQFESTKGAPPPKGKGTGGDGSGDGMGGWFGGQGSPKSPIGDVGLVKDPKQWGKGGMGDGIMGWSDGEKGPPGFHWVPNVEVGLKPGSGRPKTGPDGGYYGGIDIGMFPNQAGTGGVGSEKQRENEHKKICKDGEKTARENQKNSRTDVDYKFWKAMESAWKEWGAAGVDNQPFDVATSEDGAWSFYSFSSGERFLVNEDSGVYYDLFDSGMPRPDGGSEGDSSPLRDPQLLLQMTKAADKVQNKPDVVPGVVDPVPIRGGRASGQAGRGELAAAGAAKAEAAWRFSGKKPGSEVTDPAEWQSRGGGPSGIARDVSLITDPPEPQAGAVATDNSSAGMSERGKAFFAQFMGQFLIQSVQAAAGP